MRLLYIADGRSPIAINWISYFIRTGHEVHLVSSYPCRPIDGLSSLTVIPVALSGIYGQPEVRGGEQGKLLRRIVPVTLRTRIRQLVAPLTLQHSANALRDVIERIRPDLIHALRIPFEGIVASMAVRGKEKETPLLISVWGNDFSLHAKSTMVMAYQTRQALQTSDALHTDCHRDMNLANKLGFASTKPGIVLPGGGGVKMEVFYPLELGQQDILNQRGVDKPPVMIIHPRGFRAYVRNDTFFRAVPLVIKENPNIRFVCTGMEGESQAQKWVEQLGLRQQVELLPTQSQQEMAGLFRHAQISLSITTHDGTPNTLLEAMACGCFPIAGDIESLREWITPGENGMLVDPGDPQALAKAIQSAIAQPDLRWLARERNLKLVSERAEYEKSMHIAEEFYRRLISKP